MISLSGSDAPTGLSIEGPEFDSQLPPIKSFMHYQKPGKFKAFYDGAGIRGSRTGILDLFPNFFLSAIPSHEMISNGYLYVDEVSTLYRIKCMCTMHTKGESEMKTA